MLGNKAAPQRNVCRTNKGHVINFILGHEAPKKANCDPARLFAAGIGILESKGKRPLALL